MLLTPVPIPQKASSSPTLYYRELRYPSDDEDLNTLRQMRLASGTYYDRIPTWLEEIKAGHRIMWFVYLSMPHIPSPTRAVPDRSPVSPASLSFILNTPPTQYTEIPLEWDSPPTPPIAMVCLLKANPQDATLASIDAHRYELTSLWIYPAYRPLGVGSSIIAEMEKQAALRGASYLTFNTTAGAPGTLRTFQRIGYREYKPREHRYSVSDVLNAGLPVESSTLAAFFEKRVDLGVGEIRS
jgi:GNAT superfamily N-acetyltransferase